MNYRYKIFRQNQLELTSNFYQFQHESWKTTMATNSTSFSLGATSLVFHSYFMLGHQGRTFGMAAAGCYRFDALPVTVTNSINALQNSNGRQY